MDQPKAIVLEGLFRTFCVPEILYHGTWSGVGQAILAGGLDHRRAPRQSIGSVGANYLTTSLSMAASIAHSRAFRNGGEPMVIAVESKSLDPDAVYFDLNMSGRYWSEAVAYGAFIAPACLRSVSPEAWVPPECMQLDEPMPGERPLVLDMAWDRAPEFLEALTLVPLDSDLAADVPVFAVEPSPS